MSEGVAIAVVLGAAVALRLSIPRILKRLSVAPADQADRSDGFGDVLRRLSARSRAKR